MSNFKVSYLRANMNEPVQLISSVFVLFLLLFTISCQDDVEVLTPTKKGFTIIKNVSPVGPSVFAVANVELHRPLESEMTLEGNVFRTVVKDLRITQGTNDVEGDIVKTAGAKYVSFYPAEVLPENSTFTIVAEFGWEIKKNSGWEPVNEKLEIKEVAFTTGSYVSPVDIISGIKPVDQSTSQSLFVNPFVLFSKSINTPIAIDVINLKAVIHEVGIHKGDTDISVETALNQTNDSLTIIPSTIFNPATEYEVYLKWHWEREVNGIWQPYKRNNEVILESISTKFTTNDESQNLTTLLPENIKYAYPIPYQYHFLKKEHATGFVALNSLKQNYLFDESYKFIARFTSPGLLPIDVPLVFDKSTNRLNHAIPEALFNEKIYKLQFIRKPVASGNEDEFYVAHFRTSKFNTLIEKTSGITIPEVFREAVDINAFVLIGYIGETTEYFDYFEIESGLVITPEGINVRVNTNLVQLEAILEGNNWYENYVYPLLYAPWTDPSFKPTIKRDTSVVPLLPINAISIEYFVPAGKLTPEEIALNDASPIPAAPYTSIRYSLNPFFDSDFKTFRQQVLSKYSNSTSIPPRENALLTGNPPYLRQGFYKYRFKYVLPDGTVTSKSGEHSLENKITDVD